LDIENDDEIDGAPNSANIILRCCTASTPPNPLTEYDTIPEGLFLNMEIVT
jgi:hypothetical protein